MPVGPLACNCSLLADDGSGEAVLVDPGGDADRILEAIRREGVRVRRIVHTHAHFDHVAATGAVARATGAEVALHPEDFFLYESLPEQGRMFGFPVEPAPRVDRRLSDGERLEAGEGALRVLHTPGHTPGSCSFLREGEPPLVLTGDTLFRDSIGRTDLWGGSFEQIEDSIRRRLYVLDGATVVIPGHGERTTVGREAAGNPFVRL